MLTQIMHFYGGKKKILTPPQNKVSESNSIALYFANLFNVWLKKTATFSYLLLHLICFDIILVEGYEKIWLPTIT